VHSFTEIQSASIILTPNKHLAKFITADWQKNQIKKNTLTAETANILPLSSWLQTLWVNLINENICDQPILLNKQQEIILWDKIIKQSSESDILLQPSEAATAAMNSWRALKSTRVNYQENEFSETKDGAIFLSWITAYQAMLTKNNWLDSATLIEYLVENILAKKINLPKEIILYGFTDFSAQHELLFATIQQLNTKISKKNSSQTKPILNKINLPDQATEIQTMARWAKKVYLAEKNNCLIGCVIPQLSSIKTEVSAIFNEVFSETITADSSVDDMPFFIFSKEKLDAQPLIHHALQLLNFNPNKLSPNLIQTLLFSPFLAGSEQEHAARAIYAMELQKENIIPTCLTSFASPTKKINLNKTCPILAKTLQIINQNITNRTELDFISNWAEYFITELTTWGWPSERNLNNTEYQISQDFIDVLNNLSALDNILSKKISFATALDYLNLLTTKKTLNNPEKNTPIQIFNLLDALELPFTHLWVIGMNDNLWPLPAKPNPFIPLAIQKKYNMPHATAKYELDYYSKIFHHLKNSAPKIIFSYSLYQDDEELRPTNFIEKISDISLTTLNLAGQISTAESIFATQKLERLTDEIAPPVKSNEKIQGGAKIFKYQAACPFRAFSEIRLKANGYDAATNGLRALDRGNILHKALEYFWNTVKDSNSLISLDDNKFKAIIEDSISKAISYITGLNDFSNYLQLEFKRLCQLLTTFLTLEKQRPPFQVIACEKESTVTIKDIPIKLRVDRIDQVAEQQKIIIDYKTSKNPNINNWFGERPDEPQLPLYCLISDDKISAIAYAKIHSDNSQIIGISENNLKIKGIDSRDDWPQQLTQWKNTLDKLIDDFSNGIAKVDPKNGALTCNTCKLKPLCRIHERQ